MNPQRPLSPSQAQHLGAMIDKLRGLGLEEEADALQFGIEGMDQWDGSRCRICDQPMGGWREHRCWSESAT